jgi:hypothetical protein
MAMAMQMYEWRRGHGSLRRDVQRPQDSPQARAGMTNDQAPMTKRNLCRSHFGHWDLVIGHYFRVLRRESSVVKCEAIILSLRAAN